METKLIYFDETGDDGLNTSSSDEFILTSIYMPSNSWQDNFDIVKDLRRYLKRKYGFHVGQEMHTKYFLTDKNPYREYGWTKKEKQNILKDFTKMITSLDIFVINVIIDKTSIFSKNYSVLGNAFTYNLQRIENDSNGEWNYIVFTDEGRVSPMRKIARAKRAYNPIRSQFGGYLDKPIQGMIEDVLGKDSKESYFIQICDFISYFVYLYYSTQFKNKELPKRVNNIIDKEFVINEIKALSEIFNKKASNEQYGLVIYPR